MSTTQAPSAQHSTQQANALSAIRPAPDSAGHSPFPKGIAAGSKTALVRKRWDQSLCKDGSRLACSLQSSSQPRQLMHQRVVGEVGWATEPCLLQEMSTLITAGALYAFTGVLPQVSTPSVRVHGGGGWGTHSSKEHSRELGELRFWREEVQCVSLLSQEL